jgi:hypothetical protein
VIFAAMNAYAFANEVGIARNYICSTLDKAIFDTGPRNSQGQICGFGQFGGALVSPFIRERRVKPACCKE